MFQSADPRVSAALETHQRLETGLHTWYWMMRRCYDKEDLNYTRYGLRGITVCERWHNPINFIKDMGERPHRHTLNRKDNNGNYEPNNCEWSTRKDQQNNRSNTIFINGIPLKQLCEEKGVPYERAYWRYKHQGVRTEEELFAPPTSKTTSEGRTCGHPPIMFHEKPVSAAKLAEMAGVKKHVIYYRWRKGLRDDALLTG